ncbi:MAG: phosphoribosylaminoimidazolecarboxamide formyltransferase [Pleomorphochaeta sp.]
MDTINLKYGCNPHQKNAKIYAENLPITVLNGNPGYINLMDALNSYQLVRELDLALDLPAAASFKHVSPAGASVYYPLNDAEKKMYFVNEELSDLAVAYTRSRGADRLSSFGDFVALSRECDESTAKCIRREVSDGVIAPSYSEKALEILKNKRNGSYTVIQIDKNYLPPKSEKREIFGITFEMDRNDVIFDKSYLEEIVTKNTNLDESAIIDLIVASISVKYTQSNSVCYAYRGQTIGVGAGGQSRIHCTRLAGDKADRWLLRTHPKVLNLPFKEKLSRNTKDNVIEQYLNEKREIDLFNEETLAQYFTSPVEELTEAEKAGYLKNIRGVSLSSDAFFPFEDNIFRAYRSGVDYIVQPGGSIRDEQVIKTCDDLNMVMAFSHLRLFHH